MYSPYHDLHVLQLTIIELKACFEACPKTCMLLEYSEDKNLSAFILLCRRDLLQSSAS